MTTRTINDNNNGANSSLTEAELTDRLSYATALVDLEIASTAAMADAAATMIANSVNIKNHPSIIKKPCPPQGSIPDRPGERQES